MLPQILLSRRITESYLATRPGKFAELSGVWLGECRLVCSVENGVAPVTQAGAHDRPAFTDTAASTFCPTEDSTGTRRFFGRLTVTHGGTNQATEHRAGNRSGCRLLSYRYLICINSTLIEIDLIADRVDALHIDDRTTWKGFTGTTRQEDA